MVRGVFCFGGGGCKNRLTHKRTHKSLINLLHMVFKFSREGPNRECFKAIYTGFTSASTGRQFRFNEEDQANFNQQSTLFLLKPDLAETQWKTEDAGIVSLTREQCIEVVLEAGQHKQEQIARYWT